MDPDRRPGARRDDLLRGVAQRLRGLPRPVVLAVLAWLVFMTVWGFVRSLG